MPDLFWATFFAAPVFFAAAFFSGDLAFPGGLGDLATVTGRAGAAFAAAAVRALAGGGEGSRGTSSTRWRRPRAGVGLIVNETWTAAPLIPSKTRAPSYRPGSASAGTFTKTRNWPMAPGAMRVDAGTATASGNQVVPSARTRGVSMGVAITWTCCWFSTSKPISVTSPVPPSPCRTRPGCGRTKVPGEAGPEGHAGSGGSVESRRPGGPGSLVARRRPQHRGCGPAHPVDC